MNYTNVKLRPSIAPSATIIINIVVVLSLEGAGYVNYLKGKMCGKYREKVTLKLICHTFVITLQK